ncbi:MAG TPA: hypothetical protein VFH07_05960 [Chitinophagaceae bacterium]|nr:hypothetical protein [Chitinophagaceae bacterium]
MENYFLEKDIKVFYVKATSFPDGITEAHQKLYALIGFAKHRKIYGISYPESPGKIIYKAAAEESYSGEAEKLGCPTFIIKKGNYSSIYVKDFYSDIPAIGKAFQKLLDNPGIDPEGCCVEMYEGDKGVRCMVRLSDG